MSDEELLDLVKGVRARRRDPAPEIKEATMKKVKARKKKGKAVALKSVDLLLRGITKEQAAEALRLLGGAK